ncbi:hypothetical protein EV198_0766 [Roseivirga ehrenbergii]|nr:hypothetical protein EV198_0766 [Roseivirga ehrenbergii]
MVYYLEAVLYQKDELSYYFVYSDDLPKTGYSLIEEFHYHNEPIYLIRKNR